MEILIIDNVEFQALSLPIVNASLLVIKGSKGALGCGYINLETATKVNDPWAIVTGVKNFDDMLKAKVQAISPEAEKLGVQIGISGKDALMLMK